MDAKVKLMQARNEAAELRLRAAHQAEQAASYRRQAKQPAYDGQEAICLGQAETVEALAASTRARADLIEAEADAEYRQAAAGPEMLEALRSVTQELGDLHAAIASKGLEDVFVDESIDMLSEGRTAIDAAEAAMSTGQEPPARQ